MCGKQALLPFEGKVDFLLFSAEKTEGLVVDELM